MNDNTAIVVVTAILGGSALITALTVIGTRAWQKVEALKHQTLHGQGALAKQVESLSHEVAALRDTTTRYDIAFDTALERLESRIAQVEKNSRAAVVDSEHVGTRYRNDRLGSGAGTATWEKTFFYS